MKKLYIGLMLVLLLVGSLAFAGDLVNRNKSVDKKDLNVLTSINLDSYDYTDYSKDGLYQRCLYKENAIDTCSDWYNETSMLDDWETERLEIIVDVTNKRNSEEDKSIYASGGVTLNDK